MKYHHLFVRGAGHGSAAPDLVSLNLFGSGRFYPVATFSISQRALGSCDLAFRGDFTRKPSLLSAVRGFLRANCIVLA